MQNLHEIPVDVSDFFSHCHLPNLQRLNLLHCKISLWDLLIRAGTRVLTELHLNFINPSSTPTTQQLLSVLVSNPNLWEVMLLRQAVPQDYTAMASGRAPLHNAMQLCLSGETQHVFGLLQRLNYPATLDEFVVTLHNFRSTDVSEIIGPHLRSYFQHQEKPIQIFNTH